jgi:signal-transduction protein with cAMP-binding, CBS, and nucleotidyltransferase domain
MTFLVSAKGNDIKNWRAAKDFATTYRQVILELAASDKSGNAAELFDNALSKLGQLGNENEALLSELDGLLLEIAVTPPSGALRELAVTFYGKLYHHMGLFRSAPAFYQMSMAFLRQVSSSLMNHAADQLGLFAKRMPSVSLVAMGPAGRSEYSPFYPLQLLMVHGDTDASERETLNLLGHILHTGFEELGLRIDPVITPRNPAWRKSLAEWQQHCVTGLQQQDHTGIIELLRLADQYVLPPHEEIGQQFKELSIPLLKASHPALGNLVSRMAALSNGLSMMGNLKLERRRPETGLFSLSDHGLLPLSSAITALALIKGASANGTPQRVRELLKRNELDADLSEMILAAWHTLHELLLLREKAFSIDPNNRQPLYLDPNDLDDKQLDSLKMALETVGVIQRQVGMIFSRMGE